LGRGIGSGLELGMEALLWPGCKIGLLKNRLGEGAPIGRELEPGIGIGLDSCGFERGLGCGIGIGFEGPGSGFVFAS
jgi:hypothetical protein